MQVLLKLKAKVDLIEVEALNAGNRADVHGDNPLRGLGGHFLDVHAAVLAADNGHGGGFTIRNDGEIEFLLDVQALFHQYLAHLLALGSGLLGDQSHADDGIRHGLDIGLGLSQLDAAALAASTRVHLCFHHYRQTELVCDLLDFRRGGGKLALGGGHIVLSE